MEFDLTPEQIQLRKAVREFAESEIRPHVMEWDEAQIFPLDVIKHLGELGYMGSIFPEELGGAGLGYIEYSIIIEELSRVDGSIGIIVAAHTSLCSNHIYKSGSDEQRQRYLPKLTTGEWIGCWSLTEPEAGSDAAGTRTKAVLEDGCWTINGAKTFTTNAHYADVCVAMAVTDRAAAEYRDVACDNILDCADASGLALGALRIGQRRIILYPIAPGWSEVAATAATLGCEVLADRPLAVDMAERGAVRRLHSWLHPRTTLGDSNDGLS